MDRHHERLVDLVQVGFKPFDGCFGIENDGVLEAKRADALQLDVEVAIGLDMDLDRLRTSRGELLEVKVGTRHHQVDVAVEVRCGALRERHDIRAERQVRHEVRIHDVEMQGLRAGHLRPQDLIPQPPEIGRQKRG